MKGGTTKSRPRIVSVFRVFGCYRRFLLLVVDLHVVCFYAGRVSSGQKETKPEVENAA
jgi:hypothetical protein